jgi:hypothetical protein
MGWLWQVNGQLKHFPEKEFSGKVKDQNALALVLFLRAFLSAFFFQGFRRLLFSFLAGVL